MAKDVAAISGRCESPSPTRLVSRTFAQAQLNHPFLGSLPNTETSVGTYFRPYASAVCFIVGDVGGQKH